MPEFPFTVIWAWERQNNIPLNYTQSSPTAIPKKEWCKTVIHATITSCQVHSHDGICIHWKTKHITKGAECVPYIPCTSPLLSLCELSVMHAAMGRWQSIVKAMKIAQTKFADVWQQYKMKMAVKAPNTVWQRLSATDPSHQETYSFSAHVQALWI